MTIHGCLERSFEEFSIRDRKTGDMIFPDGSHDLVDDFLKGTEKSNAFLLREPVVGTGIVKTGGNYGANGRYHSAIQLSALVRSADATVCEY